MACVAGGRWRCLSRVASRAALVLDLLDTLDLPGRTAELARTFGIDFFSVINRQALVNFFWAFIGDRHRDTPVFPGLCCQLAVVCCCGRFSCKIWERMHCLGLQLGLLTTSQQELSDYEVCNNWLTPKCFHILMVTSLYCGCRGSQYRVESMLVRLAHSQNYLTLSPNKEQVGSQPATEALPLVMEPESRLYSCPVVVLDFQSLYPSMVIAYNLCYTTCVGRPAHAAAAAAAADTGAASTTAAAVANPQGAANPKSLNPDQQPPGSGVRLGVSNYAPPADALLPGGAADPEGLVLAPSGVGFLPPSVRPGVLPRLLHEILATRVMVKAAMKKNKADKVGIIPVASALAHQQVTPQQL